MTKRRFIFVKWRFERPKRHFIFAEFEKKKSSSCKTRLFFEKQIVRVGLQGGKSEKSKKICLYVFTFLQICCLYV